MSYLFSGTVLLALILGLFWLKDELRSPRLARMAYSELTMRLAAGLKQEFAADKINIGAIGNVVAQLHVHLVARHQGDAAWPAPVWGQSYPPADEPAQAQRLRRLGRLLG